MAFRINMADDSSVSMSRIANIRQSSAKFSTSTCYLYFQSGPGGLGCKFKNMFLLFAVLVFDPHCDLDSWYASCGRIRVALPVFLGCTTYFLQHHILDGLPGACFAKNRSSILMDDLSCANCKLYLQFSVKTCTKWLFLQVDFFPQVQSQITSRLVPTSRLFVVVYLCTYTIFLVRCATIRNQY